MSTPKSSSDKPKDCLPISSSCVIWQGPDLCCIPVCPGDTVSDINYKFARAICAIHDSISMAGLDLKCLETCADCAKPTSIHQLIQLLINAHCACCSKSTPGTIFNSLAYTYDSNSDSYVLTSADEFVAPYYLTVAQELRYANENGDPVTKLTNDAYTILIGQAVSSLITKATTTTASLVDLDSRVQALEDAEVTVPELPEIANDCIMDDSAEHPLVDFVAELADQFCEYKDILGSTSDITAAISEQCEDLSSEEALSTSGTMGSLTGWVASPSSAADTLKNMWLTICDIRLAVKIALPKLEPTCADVIVDFSTVLSSDNSTLTLHFAGYTVIPEGFTDCSGGGSTGSQLTISDSYGHNTSSYILLTDAIDTPEGIAIDLSATDLVPGSNYTVTLNGCLTNETITCNKVVIKTVTNTVATCPAIGTIATDTTINYIGNPVLTSGVVYTLILNEGSDLIGTKTHADPPGVFTDSFTGLTASTDYTLKVYVTIGSTPPTLCQTIEITTES